MKGDRGLGSGFDPTHSFPVTVDVLIGHYGDRETSTGLQGTGRSGTSETPVEDQRKGLESHGERGTFGVRWDSDWSGTFHTQVETTRTQDT